MALLDLPPGVYQTAAKKAMSSRWRETNLIRWEEQSMLPVGGWEKIGYGAFASRIRVIHKWQDSSGNNLVAYLCEEHCYVDRGDGTLTDVTPVGGIVPPPSVAQGGYGDDVYGTDDYGEPRGFASRSEAVTPCYTLDNWGYELRAMTSADGRLLRWDPATPATPLVAVTNAPINNRTFVVTSERHIIIFGAASDGSAFQWCDEEDDTNWTPGTTSKAGGFNVEPRANIVSARVVAGGILFNTTRAAYIIRHQGLPYVYGYDIVSECPPPYSAMAIAETPEGAMWGSVNGFWLYNGVNAAPVDCAIWEWIREQIATDFSKFEAALIAIPVKFEVWFFFVNTDGGIENNRVAIYNYKDRNWSMGMLTRTCGVGYANDSSPLMSDGEFVYQHETGFAYNGAPELPWAETHTINTGNGGLISTIHQLLPEIVGDPAIIQFRVKKSNNPTKESEETTSAAKLVRSNGYVDVRESARDMRMRVEVVTAGSSWSLGPIDMDIKARGKK